MAALPLTWDLLLNTTCQRFWIPIGLLAGKVERLFLDLAQDDVEEASNDSRALFFTPKVVSLDDTIVVDENSGWDCVVV